MIQPRAHFSTHQDCVEEFLDLGQSLSYPPGQVMGVGQIFENTLPVTHSLSTMGCICPVVKTETVCPCTEVNSLKPDLRVLKPLGHLRHSNLLASCLTDCLW